MNELPSSSGPDVADDTVLQHLDGHVLLVTLNRPDRLNAATPEMIYRYMQILLAAADNPAVRVIVVTGAGKGFCSGADGSRLGDLSAGKPRPEKLRRQGRFPLPTMPTR